VLLDGRRVPAEVVVDHVTTFPVEVDPLLPDRGRDDALRAARRVEAEEVPIPALGVALDELGHLALLGPVAISLFGPRRVSL
jgi:hypothetical protein